jgi:hypothetical protein
MVIIFHSYPVLDFATNPQNYSVRRHHKADMGLMHPYYMKDSGY